MSISTVKEQVHEAVQARYGELASQMEASTASCCGDFGDCCGGDLYEADTSAIPAGVVSSSLGCGDPITMAELKPGETVLDLGSGAGLDAFLAAQRVGPTGQVIGVDMTPEMIARAKTNRARLGAENVTFRHGFIEELPVVSDSVDVVISNCVINLSPDKAAVFREVFRVLRPGGRLAVSDMVTQGHFTQEQREDMAGWAACITGAEDVGDYVAAMRAAGFEQISVCDKGAPDIELVDSITINPQPRLFSAIVRAVKPE